METTKRFNLIFTLDYEIHGNGDGDPYLLMVEPTYRLMSLMEEYGAKLTILADVAEILCFKKYWEETGEDKFSYKKIEAQLKDAIKRGHDVQLHIHSSYFNAKWDGKHWNQCVEEYNMAALPFNRINEMVQTSKSYLENLLTPVDSTYNCHAFRAANWSMMPTENIYKALVDNGVNIDTSVYKGGCQGGNVSYDYRHAHSHLFSYKASCEDINLKDENGTLVEYPIYTEMRYFWNFISPLRIFRMVRAKFHRHKKSAITTQETKQANENDNRKLSLKSFFIKNPWKLDFNQASGSQMIGALKRIKKQMKNKPQPIDVVLIGHSKTFVAYNEKTLRRFLKWSNNQDDIQFGLFL